MQWNKMETTKYINNGLRTVLRSSSISKFIFPPIRFLFPGSEDCVWTINYISFSCRTVASNLSTAFAGEFQADSG